MFFAACKCQVCGADKGCGEYRDGGKVVYHACRSFISPVMHYGRFLHSPGFETAKLIEVNSVPQVSIVHKMVVGM